MIFMKKNILHIIAALAVAFSFAACESQEPDFFDKNANGAYFDYEYAADFDTEHCKDTVDNSENAHCDFVVSCVR